MKKMKWRDYLESIGLTAIVLSLIFVGFQIRQDQNLARADLGSRGLETLANLELTVSDPAFAKTYAKMLDKPGDLTDDEMVQINSLLRATRALFVRECYLKDMGVYEECDVMVRVNAPYYFGSKYAQTWWRKNWRVGPYTPEWMNDEVLKLNSDSNQLLLREIREGL